MKGLHSIHGNCATCGEEGCPSLAWSSPSTVCVVVLIELHIEFLVLSKLMQLFVLQAKLSKRISCSRVMASNESMNE